MKLSHLKQPTQAVFMRISCVLHRPSGINCWQLALWLHQGFCLGEWGEKAPADYLSLLQLRVIVIFFCVLLFIIQLFYSEHFAFVKKHLVYERTV